MDSLKPSKTYYNDGNSNNAKNPSVFSKYIREVPMTTTNSFIWHHVSLQKHAIPYTLNVIEIYVNMKMNL